MKPKVRFIKTIIDAAQKSKTSMPWSRGVNRAGFVAARQATDTPASPAKSA